MDPELSKYLKVLTRITILVMALVAIYLLFMFVFPIIGKILSYLPILFLPFIFALLLAVVIEPIVVFFEIKLRIKRSISVLLSLVMVVGGLIYLISILIAKIIQEISGMIPNLVSYSDSFSQKFIDAISEIRLLYVRLNLPVELQQSIQQKIQDSIQGLESVMDQSIQVLIKSMTFLPDTFIFLMIATVATFFIIKDRALLKTFFMRFIPGTARTKTRKVIAELFNALIGFLKAYSILISITAIITMLSLKILGVKYILTIGIIVGLLDILPVLGPGTFFIPWIIWELASGDTRLGISLLVVYIIISAVRQFLEPKIVGDNIGLHPLATLVSLYAGLQLGGVIGMILGPVLVVIFIACYRVGLFDDLKWRKVR